MPRTSKNSKSPPQPTWNGVPFIPRILYDSQLLGGGDMNLLLTTRDVYRFANKINLYIHVMAGTFDNTIELCDHLRTSNIRCTAIGNAGPGNYSTLDPNPARAGKPRTLELNAQDNNLQLAKDDNVFTW